MKKLDIHEIKNLLPHRYPFLLLDRVLEVEVGEKLVALKNVTVNEPFFEGHFPPLTVCTTSLQLIRRVLNAQLSQAIS